MKFGLEIIFLLIILFGATYLVLLSFPLSSYGGLIGILTSRVFAFIVFNIVVCSILVISDRPSTEAYNDFMPFQDFDDEADKEQMEEKINDDNCNQSSSECSSDSDDYMYYFSPDGCEEEDDDDDYGSTSNDEFGWDNDDEEYDDDLESRIEEFIAKVINGWKGAVSRQAQQQTSGLSLNKSLL